MDPIGIGSDGIL